jgi:WD40 repeat protein
MKEKILFLMFIIMALTFAPIYEVGSQLSIQTSEMNITPVYVSYGNWSLVWEYKADHEIKKVSVSSDGNYIAAVGDNWNSEEFRNDVLYLLTGNGELLWKKDSHSLFGFSDWIHDISVSRNATYIAVGSEGETYLLQRNGSIIWKKEHMEGMNRVSISDDGEYIAIGTYPIGIGWVHFLDKSGQELWNFSTVGSVGSISISKNGQYVAVGDYKGYAYLLDREGSLLWDKKLGEWCEVYVSISADGEFVGIGTSDREIAILNKNGDWLLNPTQVQHTVVGVSITSDGNLLFIPAESEGLRIYDVNAELISSFEAREKILDVDNTPEGVYVVIGSDDLRVYLLENEVIPELPSFLITPLFMISTLLAVIVYKRKHIKTDRT